MQRIRDGLYLLESARPANCFLIEGGKGLTLVDTGAADRIDDLVEELTAGDFSLDDLERVVVTHAHCEHAGGAAALLRRKRVKVYAHPDEVPILEGRSRAAKGLGVAGWLRAAADSLRKKPEPLSRVVPASPREPIRGLPQWQVLHLPGHTDGSLGLFDPAHGVLLCGDALTNRGGTLRPADGQASGRGAALETVRRLGELDVDVLCCGRGPIVRPRAWKAIEALLEAPRR